MATEEEEQDGCFEWSWWPLKLPFESKLAFKWLKWLRWSNEALEEGSGAILIALGWISANLVNSVIPKASKEATEAKLIRGGGWRCPFRASIQQPFNNLQ